MFDRTIGRVVGVDSFRIIVELDRDIKSLYKSGFQDIYEIARINSYVILPVGADRVVALVTRVRVSDETDLDSSGGVVFLPTAKRLITATMIGTINSTREYVQGVYNFPILDNPVWYVIKEDLQIIFDYGEKADIDFKKNYFLPIGTCPAFADFEVKINPDRLFNKHAAVLGNTGSGKSCTIASLLQSIFRFQYNDGNESKQVNNAHIVIFDTNGEYRRAFSFPENELNNRVNPFYIGQEGLKVPYWFMNYEDFDYLFKPSAQTQAPILKKALAMGKGELTVNEFTEPIIPEVILNKIIRLHSLLTQNNADTKKFLIHELDDLINSLISLKDIKFESMLSNLLLLKKAKSDGKLREEYGIKGDVSSEIIHCCCEHIGKEIEKITFNDKTRVLSLEKDIDLPKYFSFLKLSTQCIDDAVADLGASQTRFREFVSSLRLRLSSFYSDERISIPLMLKSTEIPNALPLFLRYVTGMLTQCINDVAELRSEEILDGTDSCLPGKEYSCFEAYHSRKNEKGFINVYNPANSSQITIIDMSLLPFEVLENVTGLIARLILEFLQRIEKAEGDQGKRGSFPVVLVLEEAQNYIPEIDRDKEHISISKRVFERIAREGRKYGLSLLISSQRPAELSKTILSQCNTFIVHRLQNPDDQRYVRQLVSSATEDILSQLPILPQQHAIIMGDAVRSPVQIRINNVDPKPASEDPEFFINWINRQDQGTVFEQVADIWLDLQKCANEYETEESDDGKEECQR